MLISRCPSKVSCAHRWTFGEQLDYGCVIVDGSTYWFSIVLGKADPVPDSGRATSFVDRINQRTCSLGGTKRVEEERLMASFLPLYGLFLLCHASSPSCPVLETVTYRLKPLLSVTLLF